MQVGCRWNATQQVARLFQAQTETTVSSREGDFQRENVSLPHQEHGVTPTSLLCHVSGCTRYATRRRQTKKKKKARDIPTRQGRWNKHWGAKHSNAFVVAYQWALPCFCAGFSPVVCLFGDRRIILLAFVERGVFDSVFYPSYLFQESPSTLRPGQSDRPQVWTIDQDLLYI